MFTIDTKKATWSLRSGDEQLTDCIISVNQHNLLEQAEIAETSTGLLATGTYGGLACEIRFTHEDDGWHQLNLSIRNTAGEPRYITRIIWFSHPLLTCFNSPQGELTFIDEACRWLPLPGDTVNVTSRMIGALTQGTDANAWVVGFAPPQQWPSSVDVFVEQANLTNSKFSAFVNQGPAPLRIEPGEELVLDSLVLSCQRPVLEGLQAFGKLFSPRTPVSATKGHAGYNTWEYYRDSITADACLQDLETLTSHPKTRDRITTFILDHGWQKACGDWVFDVDRFGMDADEWCHRVTDKGLKPGIWVAPFLADESVISKLGTDPISVGWGKRFVLDPSDPVVIDHVCGQLHDLAAAGFTYFKTDFLSNANKLGMRHYKHSNRTAETVFRAFFARLREAIGEDAFWLACGTDRPACAGLVDAARIATDVKANWLLLSQRLLPTVMGRFWMHGNCWINDADFLILKGDHLKPDCPHTLNDNQRVPFQGLTHDEAVLWASCLVIAGSLVTWSDSPRVIDEGGFDIVARCVDHCGGPSGIPLDFGQSPLPERWVKQEGDALTLALFNFGEEEKTLSMSADEVPELATATTFRDIFSDEIHRSQAGSLTTTLRPHAAVCLLHQPD